MKRFLSLLLLLSFIPFFGQAQSPEDVVNWSYTAKKIGDNIFMVSVKAKLKPHWHIYAQDPGGDGSQIPTEIKFNDNPNVQLIGKLKPIGKITSETIDPVGTIHIYLNTVTFKQKVKASSNTTLKGALTFQVCNEQMCLPPVFDQSFSVNLKNTSATSKATSEPNETKKNVSKESSDKQPAVVHNTETEAAADDGIISVDSSNNQVVAVQEDSAKEGAIGMNTQDTAKIAAAKDDVESNAGGGLWSIFITGLLAGLAAFITPCIYAMLPITVSFFTKRSKDRASGIKNATLYSLSIIAIFLVVGFLISAFFSETTMYSISTSVWFNLFVFAIFVFFAISLLGAFEITLPSSWSARLDKKASSTNLLGIFFMALVLVVVSFSCTSAFISFLIVRIVQVGDRMGGLIGFLGFGAAIALPFAIFAFFPGLLNNIAKSGGWLNSVKVAMGFIELALAMKFLSNVDLQYHWHLLDYNVYLALWIIIFGLLGLYLLGVLNFSHDEGLPKNMFGKPYLSVTRLFFSMAALAFALYMIPGMFGAPLLGISGWLPEKKTLNANFYDKLTAIQTMGSLSPHQSGASLVNQKYAPKKYTDFLESELPGVPTYFDYQEALSASKALHKPILLDFTGHSCVNCRKMEAAVLKRPKVLEMIKSNFIFASLFADERHKLPPNEQYVNSTGSKIRTIGEKNIDLEVNKYGEIGQPMYIFVDSKGEVIKNAGGYVPDVDRFLNIMNKVVKKYKQPEHKYALEK